MPEEPRGRHPAREGGQFGSANSVRPLVGLRRRWVSRRLASAAAPRELVGVPEFPSRSFSTRNVIDPVPGFATSRVGGCPGVLGCPGVPWVSRSSLQGAADQRRHHRTLDHVRTRRIDQRRGRRTARRTREAMAELTTLQVADRAPGQAMADGFDCEAGRGELGPEEAALRPLRPSQALPDPEG